MEEMRTDGRLLVNGINGKKNKGVIHADSDNVNFYENLKGDQGGKSNFGIHGHVEGGGDKEIVMGVVQDVEICGTGKGVQYVQMAILKDTLTMGDPKAVTWLLRKKTQGAMQPKNGREEHG